MKEIKLNIKGMMCNGCENRVKNAVGDIEGVIEVKANHETGEVIVNANDNVQENVIKETIEDIGYEIL